MTVHHWICESDIKENCIYCGNDLNDKKWESSFEGDSHYKTLTCECGKNNRVRVNFLGSGHDSWDGTCSWDFVIEKDDKKLEVKIKELERFKEIKRVDKFGK